MFGIKQIIRVNTTCLDRIDFIVTARKGSGKGREGGTEGWELKGGGEIPERVLLEGQGEQRLKNLW